MDPPPEAHMCIAHGPEYTMCATEGQLTVQVVDTGGRAQGGAEESPRHAWKATQFSADATAALGHTASSTPRTHTPRIQHRVNRTQHPTTSRPLTSRPSRTLLTHRARLAPARPRSSAP